MIRDRPSSNTLEVVVVGFLAGFSERFTRNLLNVAESHLGGSTVTLAALNLFIGGPGRPNPIKQFQ
jgi:hypothetical protein